MKVRLTLSIGMIELPVESIKSIVAVYQGLILVTLVTGEQKQAIKAEFYK